MHSLARPSVMGLEGPLRLWLRSQKQGLVLMRSRWKVIARSPRRNLPFESTKSAQNHQSYEVNSEFHENMNIDINNQLFKNPQWSAGSEICRKIVEMTTFHLVLVPFACSCVFSLSNLLKFVFFGTLQKNTMDSNNNETVFPTDLRPFSFWWHVSKHLKYLNFHLNWLNMQCKIPNNYFKISTININLIYTSIGI